MNWIVTYDGKEHDSTGADATYAAQNLTRRLLPPPEESLGKTFEMQCRRSAKKLRPDETKTHTIVFTVDAYWSGRDKDRGW